MEPGRTEASRFDFGNHVSVISPVSSFRTQQEATSQGFSRGMAPPRQPFRASQAQQTQFSGIDSQMTTDSPPRSTRGSEPKYFSQISALSTDSSGANDSLSQGLGQTFSQGSIQGDLSDERPLRGSFLNSKRGPGSSRPPPSGPAAPAYASDPSSSSVSAYISSANKAIMLSTPATTVRAPSSVYDKMRSTSGLGKSLGKSAPGNSPGRSATGSPGGLESVVSALRNRPAVHQQTELKEHYTKGIDKIEQMLEAAERGREEDRRQMISLQAELGKFCEIVSTKLDDTKTDMAACAQRLTQAISDMEAKLETTNNCPATGRDISKSRLSEKENVSMEEDEDELDLFADPFGQALEHQAAKRHAKQLKLLTYNFKAKKPGRRLGT